MKFMIGLALFTATMFGSMFIARVNHFDDQKIACIRAGGDGRVTKGSVGIPVGYECHRMHLLMKYRNGEYK